MSNAKGSYQTTTANAMAAFDKLPPTLRAALRESIENWVAQPVLTRWRRGISVPELVKKIKEWDKGELAKREYQRSHAIGLYRGNAPDEMPKRRAVR